MQGMLARFISHGRKFTDLNTHPVAVLGASPHQDKELCNLDEVRQLKPTWCLPGLSAW